MIIIAGTMTFDPAAIAPLEQAVKAMVGTVRAEDGCHHYSLLPEDPAAGLVNVLEIWRDEPALRVHLAQPWTAAFLAQFGPKLQNMNVNIHEVATTHPLAL